MEYIRGLHNLRPRHHGCVLTIGNFDGLHLGHQAVLGQLAESSKRLGLPTTVMLFEPQPEEYFSGADAPARLTRLREKLITLGRFSVDRVLGLRFDASFAHWSAEAFIEHLLVQRLGVRYLVVGDDFRFGCQRKGDFALLEQAGARHGFQVVRMHTFSSGDQRVSSTRVRVALAQGDLAQAEALLGRPYCMHGRVAHGDKRGRQLGFPTANVHLHRRKAPLQGVYAVQMFGLDQEPLAGVANVGTRPTVAGTRSLLEVHLLDFAGDIYGRHVRVDFLAKLRDEQRFASLDELKAQIGRDKDAARDYFSA